MTGGLGRTLWRAVPFRRHGHGGGGSGLPRGWEEGEGGRWSRSRSAQWRNCHGCHHQHLRGHRPTANGHRGTTIIHQSSRPRSWQPMFVVVVVAAAATVPMATAKEGAMQESGRAEPKASFAGTSLQSRLEIKVPSIAPSIHLAARFRRRKGPCAPPSPPPRRMFRRSPLAHRRRGGFTGRAHQTLERASVQGPGSRVDRGPSRPAGRPVAGATRHARRFP